ncbi:uroporphyrinogen decarboxylase [Brumimicrobium aurantiacum]|uniref:Uroporphyrinogen decarboxylase n=1 Tax=Brumimicrobium aurantiacum TaxID=1737063 RepID=A0A3E1EZ27_9FLAO|nr:uroporphyrinogen decarboxylase [Brumimicrobium aurantiacum]RFC54821.1 uroporphyrinogen decarboxylase [Brumimicrobium aurantiacum]
MDIKNDLLLRAARGEDIERYPVWLMRQAGRILPEYRAVRNSLSGFKELVETPALAAEVTIQPVDHLDVDAAIIFSDILVIPEAMGLEYQMVEKVGPYFEKTIKNESDLLKYGQTDFNVEDRLGYVKEALEITKKELNGRVPLIGFAGAPWTIFCYMIEGGGSKTFSASRKMLYQNPTLAHDLLERITDVTIRYLKMQIKAGADIIQVFDSWAGILGNEQYLEFGLKYMNKIAEAINEVPVTLFSKGAYAALPHLAKSSCNTIGLDWNMNASEVRKIVGEEKTLQGNLDPCALYASHNEIEQLTINMLDSFKSKRHIVNLGHGVYPDINPEKVQTFIKTVKNYGI